MTGARSPTVRLTGAALLNLCLGTLFAWSVFLLPIQTEFGASRGEISAVFSWSLVVFAAAVVFAGRLIGRLRSDVVAIAAAGFTAAGMLLASTATTVVTLGLGYVGLVASANGLGYLTAVNVGSAEFDRRRGLATGIVVAAYAGGPLLAGPLAGALIPVLGWRRVMAALGTVLGVLMLGAAALIGRSSRVMVASSWSAEEAAPSQRLRRSVVLLWVIFLTGALPGLFAFGHAASIAGAGRQVPGVGGLVVAAMAVGNMVGRTAGGEASDHVGRRPALVGTLAAIVLVCATLGLMRAEVVVVGGLIILGAAYGALSALIPATTADLVGPRRFGRMYGWVFTGWGVAGLLGPLLGAMVHDRTGQYLLAFRVGALTAVIGLLCTVASSVGRPRV